MLTVHLCVYVCVQVWMCVCEFVCEREGGRKGGYIGTNVSVLHDPTVWDIKYKNIQVEGLGIHYVIL